MQRCIRRFKIAVVIFASPRTCALSAKVRSVVMMTLVRP